jgi:UDP:flavonoid glycosyltransferase YjiC (YdhE family)
MNKPDSKQMPLVGFFPGTSNLADTGRAIMIAKRYKELGGRVIFFSHGGKYEFLIQNNGFKMIRVKPIVTDEQMEEYFRIIAGKALNSELLIGEEWLLKNVEEEIAAFKKTGIKLLVSTLMLTCAISTRAAKIPYVSIVTGSGRFAIKIPDTLESIVTRVFPQWLNVWFLNWFINKTQWYLKHINKVAKKVGVPKFKHPLEIFHGDFNFATNYLEFVNIFPNQQLYPTENYIGMILLDELFIDDIPKKEAKKIEEQIKKHLKRPGKSIMVSLGSSGTKDIFLGILEALNKTEYNVIAIYTSILDEKDLPELNDNILLEKFVPSISKVNRMVDLAIIHGGQGTVYTAVYAKKPVIGYPMHMEQHLNLEKLVGHGTGLMLSKRYFSEQKLLDAINKIFSNYDEYLTDAENLSNKIPSPEGDKNAAQKIFEIMKKEKLN